MKSFITIIISILLINNFSFAQEQSTNIGGYGELHLNIPEGSSKKEIDFHRFIIYLSHNFNDQMSFMSELEIEHGGKELELEQAYLEYRFSKQIGIRAGVLLIPINIINLYHEPPTFHGVERPNFTKSLIPTTWWENGIGIFGNISDGIDYVAQITAGLRADGFSAKDGIRGGRQKGIESFFDNPSFSGSINFNFSGNTKVGLGTFLGNTVPSTDIRSGKINTNGFISVSSAYIQKKIDNFEIKSELALINLSDAKKINQAYPIVKEKYIINNFINDRGDTIPIPVIERTFSSKNIATQMNGFLFEIAYEILREFTKSSHQLWLFARLEKYNTQAKMPEGFSPNNLYNRTEITMGLTYKPIYNAVAKIDLQLLSNRQDGFKKNIKQINFGIGYYFF